MSETSYSSALHVGNLINDRYLIESHLGTGGMTRAYQARDLTMPGEPVVLKFVSEEFSVLPQAEAALQHESKILNTVSHPHIVQFLAEDKYDQRSFIVLEYIHGIVLNKAMQQAEIYLANHNLCISIIQQLKNTLRYLHARDIVHGDIKPANMMLMRDGSIKLIDFSSARYYQNHADSFDPAVLLIHTPKYASDSLKNGKPAMPEDDIYALEKICEEIISIRA